MLIKPEEAIAGLDIWNGRITIEPLSGGMTNRNFCVKDDSGRYAVRFGEDIPVHMISRSNELAASRAAYAAGLSPKIIYHAPGILVMDYLEARTLSHEDIDNPAMISRLASLLRTCHNEIPKYFRGPAMIFWVFQVIRDYANSLRETQSVYTSSLTHLLERARHLETAAGPYQISFGHNDLLAANILDDGQRLWLIDWDYAGFNSPLFDLGGLSSNNSLPQASEVSLLENYYEAPVTDELWRRYQAMKCASLLRETMWSMISETHSTIGFDYRAYTTENRARFEAAYEAFSQI